MTSINGRKPGVKPEDPIASDVAHVRDLVSEGKVPEGEALEYLADMMRRQHEIDLDKERRRSREWQMDAAIAYLEGLYKAEFGPREYPPRVVTIKVPEGCGPGDEIEVAL